MATAVAENVASNPEIKARLDLACGSTTAIISTLYGDATAIAGDFVGHPSELLSPTGAWRFSSRKHYYLLALENSSHFNPTTMETWREHHQAALERALEASRADGLSRLQAWGEALRENAFADHMLQDSFASGHMGFNRRASSAAAAKRFHDYWNGRGRRVADRSGATWFTHGDGRLNDAGAPEGRRHVLDAATLSIKDLLMTFVFARRNPEGALAAWRALPFTIEAPELLVDAEGLVELRRTSPEATQTPLAAAILPARKNTVARADFWMTSPFSSSAVIAAVTGDFELALPILPAQALVGGGATLETPDGRRSAVIDFGMLAPLFLSLDGLLSHEVVASGSLLLRKDVMTVIHAEYRLNIELGTSMITAHVGLAEFVPGWHFGWFALLGYGFVVSAAGGGSF